MATSEDLYKLLSLVGALPPSEEKLSLERITRRLIDTEGKKWRELWDKDRSAELESINEFIKRMLKEDRPKSVTEFIETHTYGDGDHFYTPYESMYKTHDEALADYNGKWNQNRGENGEDDPEQAPDPKMFGFLELPYGHICNSCGGSMVAVIQLDEHRQPLKTILVDCG